MKARKRLTSEESKELTRLRLIEAAEELFIRSGFDDTSVEEISAMAGYSRGAFYSNFDNKEQVFLALIDLRRPKALDNILRRVSESVERIAAVRNWFANQWRLKDFIASGWNSAAGLLEIVPSGRTSPNCFGRNSKLTPLPWAASSARRTKLPLSGRKS